MAISYPLNWFGSGLSDIVLRTKSVVAVSQSPFTGKQQVHAFPGQWWEADVSFPPMKRAAAEEVLAALISLNGREGTFLMPDPNGVTPRGSAASTPGTPLVDGGSQTGNTLDIKGAPAGETGWLKKGDYFQLGTGTTARLYKCLLDIDTDSAGNATLTFWPNLRISPSNEAAIIVSNAMGRFRLAGNTTEFSIDVATFYGFSFSAVEAI